MSIVDDPEWQARMPAVLQKCLKQWSIQLGEQLDGGYVAAVFGCTGPNGEDLVLKMSPPIANPTNEARALAHWNGRGAAKLAAWNEDALLLERVRPGTYLMDRGRTEPDDDAAVRAASSSLAEMHAVPAPPAAQFPSFEERLRFWIDWAALHGEPETQGMRLLSRFERCALALDASAPGRTLTHGDFVAKNLLLGAGGSYFAIDPLPCFGDPCSDAGQFSAFHSPVATVVPRARATARAIDLDVDRAAQWAAVWTVFQACETWRDDSDDLQAWAAGDECRALLAAAEG